jgi:hypothetical protein
MGCLTNATVTAALLLAIAQAAIAQPHAPPGPTAPGLRAPVQCTVAENIAQECSPELTGVRIVIIDGDDSTECGNLGDLGLGGEENLCRWSADASLWVTDDVAGFAGGGTHPIEAGDFVAGAIAIADIAAAAKTGLDLELVTGTAATGECGEFDANGDLVGAGQGCGVSTYFSSATDLDAAGYVADDSHNHTDSTHPVLADHNDTLTEIAAALKSGDDATLVTGTAATGECGEFDANGDLVGAGAACGSGGGTHPIAKGDYGALSIVNGDISDELGDRIFGTKITPATELLPGVAQFANQATVDIGTDINKYVRPVTLHGAAMTGDLVGSTFGAAAVVDASHAHTVANLSDTTAAAGELDDLTDNSDADGLHTHTDTSHPVLADHIDTLTEIAAGIREGAGTKLATVQLAGSTNDCATWSGTGGLGTTGTDCSTLDAVSVDGAGVADPDFRSEGDLDAIRCTGAGTPDADCVAINDVIFRITDFSQANDLDAAGDVANASHTHTVANLSDTGAAAGELDDVTDGSNADALHVHTDTGHPVLANHIDTLTEIATALKSGDDATLVTGTATNGECGQFDSNGDLVGAGAACGSGGGGDSVEIDGVAAVDPDFRSEGDLDAIRCTGPGAPDASCAAAEDVLYRYNAGSVADADVDAAAAIAGSKLATDVVLEADVTDGLKVVGNEIQTDSEEFGFINDLAGGDLSCGSGTAGTMAVNDDDPLQYCDGAAPPVRRTAAHSDDAGLVTDFSNASDLDAAGDVANASHTHTVANLSDTTAAAGELDDLTDNSDADGLHTHTDTSHPVLADHIDLLTEIATALKSGIDADLITGTATTGECVEYDSNGDAIGYGAPCDFPDDFRIGGALNLLDTSGTTPTLASGATPSVNGASVWKTEGTTTLTNFTGSPTVGDTVLIWVKNTMFFDCSRSGGALFFCDGGFLEDMPSRNGEMVLWFWDGTYWRLISVSNAARLDVASITIRAPTVDDDVYFFKVPGNKSADVVYFTCIASGAESSPSLNVRLMECNTTGQSCATTGGDHDISQRYLSYIDNAPGTITDYTITGSKFWQLDLNTVTVPPTLLDCDIAYYLY